MPTSSLEKMMCIKGRAGVSLLIAVGSITTSLADNVRFIALGDWGGQGHYPYFTEAQAETSDGMARVAGGRDGAPAAEFVLSLGDNFYHRGLEGGEDGLKRFESTYESIYHQKELDIPWMVIAGNHDHCGTIDQQLELSSDHPRWNFPDYNHIVTREFSTENGDNMKMVIIMIDTIHLAGVHCPHPHHEDELLVEEDYRPPPGHDPEDSESLNRADMTLRWIEEALSKSSDADYLLVAGHYPIYSACSHGSTPHLIRDLDPLLRKYKVTAYLSGHEHCQFHFEHEEMNYILTGNGQSCCYADRNRDRLPRGGDLKYILVDDVEYSGTSGVRGGFASFEAAANGLSFHMHRENGDVLYEATLFPRSRVEPVFRDTVVTAKE